MLSPIRQKLHLVLTSRVPAIRVGYSISHSSEPLKLLSNKKRYGLVSKIILIVLYFKQRCNENLIMRFFIVNPFAVLK